MKRKKTILQLFLVPALIIMLIQGMFPLGMLFFSGVKDTLDSNAEDMAERLIENKRVILENSMTEQWSSVYGESQELNELLKEELYERDISISDFLSSQEAQISYLKKTFPLCAENLQHNLSSGIFLVLASDSPVSQPGSYNGFFLRDSDPKMKNVSNTDFLLERGSKILARQENIPLDSTWTTYFDFKGAGNRESDSFFYKPYLAASDNPDTDMKNLGYWSMPFVFDEPYADPHEMITYSVPLIYNGTVYGILGAEVFLSYLRESVSFRELSDSFDAGVVLAVEQHGEKYRQITGTGKIYEEVQRSGSDIELEMSDGLYSLSGTDNGIYAVKSSMKLYSNNVPYNDTRWCLIGFVSDEAIFGAGDRIFSQLLVVVLIACVFGLICILILLNVITRPINSLMTSVRGGISGIHNFRRSGVHEIDELHNVVEKLTDEQYKNEVHLREEKERYKIAVESSNDVFYTYRIAEQKLEIVNSKSHDGVYQFSSENSLLDDFTFIHPADKRKIKDLMQEKVLSEEVRIMFSDDEGYKWSKITGNVFTDQEGRPTSIAGYIRDIDFQKQLEIIQKEKEKIDPVTKFYKIGPGLEIIMETRTLKPEGIMALFNIKGFSKINDEYGLVFGDILLEEISSFIQKCCINRSERESVFVRAGSDKLLIWMPDTDRQQAEKCITEIQKHFSGYVNDNLLALRMDCGMAAALNEGTDEKTLLEMVRSALGSAGRGYGRPVFYDELTDVEKKKGSEIKFGRIVSTGFTGPLSPVSLALSLFDKGGKISVIMDLLSLKLQESYRFDDLMITILNEKDRVNTIEYSWKKAFDIDGSHVHYDEKSFLDIHDELQKNDIRFITDSIRQSPLFEKLIGDRNGYMINMYDNGKYMGSVFIFGIKENAFGSADELKELKEIGTIIQNRINQERHDLSARAKTNFLSRMSHEIRTPMNGIIGMTEIALKKGQSEARITDCLQKIRSSSGYLLGLLNDILDMSKIESGKMQLVEEDADIEKMFDRIFELIGSKIEEKHIRFEKKIELTHKCFKCDELRISQVLINLLGNAVKFTEDGGRIKLSVAEKIMNDKYSVLCFEVADNGCGINEEDQLRIFQHFEQANNGRNERKQGTGLGLAISSKLIHMMDSDIKLKSVPGEGSVFSFDLQLAVSKSDSISADDDDAQLLFENTRILAVEDNDLNLEIITAILENYNITVEGAVNGKEAAEKLGAADDGYYDMVLMDIMMPVMDGLEAARVIRNSDREYLKTVPIIAMSANAFDEDVKKSHESGMDGHLSKPVDIRKLSAVLRQYISEKIKM